MNALKTLYNNALFHVGQHIRHGHVRTAVEDATRLLRADPALDADAALRVLDAGSGGGAISFTIARALPRARVEGVELIPEKAAQCNDRARQMGIGNASFAQGDVTAIGRSSQYHLAVSVDVFEHVVEDGAAMQSVYDALLPGGIFVLHVPRAAPRRFLRHLEDHHQEDHVRDGYVPHELGQRLEQIGFRVLETRATFGTAGELAWEVMQVGMALGGRRGDLLRIALWPLLKVCCWIDVRSGKSGQGNGVLVLATRRHEAVRSSGNAA